MLYEVITLSEFKRNGGRFIAINPVRTGYAAIADEWVPIKPGTDGALLLSLVNEVIRQGLYDRDFLVNYSNAAELVNLDEASSEEGMFVRAEVPAEEGCFDPQNKLWWDRNSDSAVVNRSEGADPYLLGSFKLADGTPVKQGIFEAQYTVLRENGHSPSEAFNETVEELTQSLMPLVAENGMDWMYANVITSYSIHYTKLYDKTLKTGSRAFASTR